MPLHSTAYQHWEGVHRGVWSRRWCIARAGVAAALRNKWMRGLVIGCWMVALIMAAVLFLIGQLLVADSIIVQWAGNLNPGLQSFVRMWTTWLEQHPEISVRITQNLLFYYFCWWMTFPSIFALGMVIPLLITRDLASKAIIIYSSKAITRGDYLLGKFATAFGVLAVTWLGPFCAAWLVGNLLAPDWRFFWHSRAALGHGLLYVVGGMTLLSLLAMGISAVSHKEKTPSALWYCWWVLGTVLVGIALQTQPWLAHASFHFNLDQLATAIFDPAADITNARENVPVLRDLMRGGGRRVVARLSKPETAGALITSTLMIAATALIIRKRVKPE